MTGIEYTKSASPWSGIGPRGYWRAKLGDVDVVRPTKKEAHDALIEALREIVSGSYQPESIGYITGGRVLVYRKPEGWCYVISDDRVWSSEIQLGSGVGRTEAIRKARLHLAQTAYPDYSALSILEPDGEAVITHLRWISWQRAYTHAEMLGDDDLEAHHFACEQSNDIRRWLSSSELAAYRQYEP